MRAGDLPSWTNGGGMLLALVVIVLVVALGMLWSRP